MHIPDKAKRELRGCDCESDKVPYEWDPELKRCPRSLFTPEMALVLSWWGDWATFHVLPRDGAWRDQPAWAVQALRICAEANAECDRESHPPGDGGEVTHA
jgi:hypothetical protein